MATAARRAKRSRSAVAARPVSLRSRSWLFLPRALQNRSSRSRSKTGMGPGGGTASERETPGPSSGPHLGSWPDGQASDGTRFGPFPTQRQEPGAKSHDRTPTANETTSRRILPYRQPPQFSKFQVSKRGSPGCLRRDQRFFGNRVRSRVNHLACPSAKMKLEPPWWRGPTRVRSTQPPSTEGLALMPRHLQTLFGQ